MSWTDTAKLVFERPPIALLAAGGFTRMVLPSLAPEERAPFDGLHAALRDWLPGRDPRALNDRRTEPVTLPVRAAEIPRRAARRRWRPNTARRKTASTARVSSWSHAQRHLSQNGRLSTHWRCLTCGKTRSTNQSSSHPSGAPRDRRESRRDRGRRRADGAVEELVRAWDGWEVAAPASMGICAVRCTRGDDQVAAGAPARRRATDRSTGSGGSQVVRRRTSTPPRLGRGSFRVAAETSCRSTASPPEPRGSVRPEDPSDVRESPPRKSSEDPARPRIRPTSAKVRPVHPRGSVRRARESARESPPRKSSEDPSDVRESPPCAKVRPGSGGVTRGPRLRSSPCAGRASTRGTRRRASRARRASHASHDVVTHHHTRVTPSDDNLPDFLRILHGETSKALNTLLIREGYDAPGEIFDDRQTHRMRLLDAEAQASHHVYEHLNTTAAGLVSRPEHMPGVKLSHDRWRSGLIVVPRPPIYVDPRTNPTELPLYLTPDPELYAAFDGDLAALTHHLDRLIDHGLGRIRDARRGRTPLGAKAVRRLHPWSEPRTLRETRGQRIRTFKPGARDILGVQLEVHAAAETTRFRVEHRDARIAQRDGDTEHVYPYGTYAARVHQGAPVESEPPADAVLAKPGRTLEEVKRELAERGSVNAEQRRTARHRLVDEVRAAWTEEAESVIEHADIELCRKVTVTASNGDAKTDETATARGRVEVRHRLPTRGDRGAACLGRTHRRALDGQGSR